MVKKIPCAIIRGGTSKGVYLLEENLPEDIAERKEVILKIFGSPDKRQIDGLGGADPLTSKVAIVRKSDCPEYDVIYTYGQVAIDQPAVFFKGICGNISSGVGPFAIDEGLVEAVEPTTTVRIFNTNTKKVFTAKVPVRNGKADVYGEYEIAGCPGTGARIRLDFSATEGAITGKLLPTGHVRDEIEVAGFGTIEVSIVDCSVVEVYVRASDMGICGTETPSEIDSNPELLKKCEALRGTVAAMLGLASSAENAVKETANIPHLVIVSKPADYENYLIGQQIKKEEIDFTARMLFLQKTHKTYAGTGSICTSVAARIPGSVVNACISADNMMTDSVRIGHPGGIIEVEAIVRRDDKTGNCHVQKVEFSRTARRIMDGFVYCRE